MTTAAGARGELAARQHAVLEELLAGRVPAGFDPVGSALTTRVLHRKRSSAALRACPELAELPGWRERFHDYAARTAVPGCAHDDVRRFAAGLAAEEPDWARLHELYDGRRLLAWVRVGGHRTLLVRCGTRVLRLTRRPGNGGA